MKIVIRNNAETALFDYFNQQAAGHDDIEIIRAKLSSHKDKESFSRLLDVGSGGKYLGVKEEDLKGEPIVLIHSSGFTGRTSADEYFTRTLFTIDTLRDMGAGPIWLVEPYAAYTRQDRRTKKKAEDGGGEYIEALTNKYAARHKHFAGAVGWSTVDVHSNAAFADYEDVFGVDNVFNLDPAIGYAEHFKRELDLSNLLIANPDGGADVRAQHAREIMGLDGKVSGSKERDNTGDVGSISKCTGLEGAVAGKDILAYDDIGNTGGTLENFARTLKDAGARNVYAAVTAGTFGGDGLKRIFSAKTNDSSDLIDKIFVSNAISQIGRMNELRDNYLPEEIEGRIITMGLEGMLWDHIIDDIKPHAIMQPQNPKTPAP